jgi:BirA family biotin operon repressor/biotin-[acetyl-CoA-carboxylase] ligase
LNDQQCLAQFDLAAFKHALGDHACRFDAAAVAECNSTNVKLLAMAETGTPSGTVLVADRQTSGRGRRGRTWHSASGDSLTFSLLWRFPADSQAPIALSLVVGLAVAKALESLGAASIGLKWPNDLIHENRKLGGILIELVSGAPRSAVIGVGLNLRVPAGLPEDLRDSVTALAHLLAQMPSREVVLAALLAQLADTFEIYAVQGFAFLRQAWLSRHVHTGQTVRLLADHARETIGICTGVDDDGALLLDISGIRQRFVAGEISLRPA